MPPKPSPDLPAPLRAVMEEFIANQRELDELEPRFEAVKTKNDELRAKFHEYMTNAGLTSVKTDTMGTFIRSIKGPYASVVDRDKAEDWAKKNGLFDVLFKFMPVSSRISAVVAETLRGDNELDAESLKKEEIFDWVIRKSISWRRPEGLERKAS